MQKIFNFITGLRIRNWVVPAVAILLLALLYTGGWVYGATQTVRAVEQWIGERRAEGYRIRYRDLRATGYPLWIRIDLADPGIAAPKAETPWAWQAGNLLITARPWAPGRVRLATGGEQMISYQDGARRLTYAGTLTAAAIVLTFAKGVPQSIGVNVSGLDLAAQRGAVGKIAIAAADLTLRRLEFIPGSPPDAASMALDIKASGIELPALIGAPLGGRMASLRVAARLLGQFPRGAGAPPVEALEIWRDGGGTVEVDRLSLRYGPLALRADGTLALDRDLQPIGAFTARIQGFFETIDALSRAGVIGAGQAVSAKMLLGVFAHRPPNGARSILNLALTVQQRELYAGPVKLLRLPLVRWR